MQLDHVQIGLVNKTEESEKMCKQLFPEEGNYPMYKTKVM